MKRTVLLVPAVALLTTVLLAQPPAFSIPEHYTKYEFRHPDARRRAAVHLRLRAEGRLEEYPFLMTRTPYSVAPYGVDEYKTRLGPSEAFDKAGYILVRQDVAGTLPVGRRVRRDAPAHPTSRNRRPTSTRAPTPTTRSSGW